MRNTKPREINDHPEVPTPPNEVDDDQDSSDSEFHPISNPDNAINHNDAVTYWQGVEPTVNGMLGGYPHISRVDLLGSRAFLTKLRRKSALHPTTKPLNRIVDCGAGIGRITTGLFSEISKVVDIVEPVLEFTEAYKQREEVLKMKEEGKMGEVYQMGLEDWIPGKNGERYSVIWNQWCLSQLNDKELLDYLRRCQPALEKGGWIVVKENTTKGDTELDIFDEQDSSVVRSDAKYRRIFEEAGLSVVRWEIQKGFPQDLYPVRCYALIPEKAESNEEDDHADDG